MTDKQIIIDSVDVSKCIYFQQEDNEYTCGAEECNGAIVACRACDNCYYKQLKRKEQECEELKEGYSELTEIVAPYMDDFTGYNEELGGFDIVLCVKELMEQLEAYKMEAEEGKEINAELKAENDNIKETFDGLFKVQYKLADNNKKLRQCLTEIKEIIQNQGHIDILEEQILQKISECEGNDGTRPR